MAVGYAPTAIAVSADEPRLTPDNVAIPASFVVCGSPTDVPFRENVTDPPGTGRTPQRTFAVSVALPP
jgi:hypothetical protein